MCLAIPGKILSREGDVAKIDFGGRVIREANIAMVECGIGDYVIVHAGFAIQRLDEAEAKASLDTFKEILGVTE